MNDHDMEINAFASASALDEAEAMVVTDVKHYAVDIDADGNEVRREIPAFDIPETTEPTA